MRRGTYSIVARDPLSGELGVAVQSHWFAVGALVAWARPGVGAAATQSVAEVAHGPGMLERMADGLDAREAIAQVLSADELAGYRQLGAIDAAGGAAVHTGSDCIAHAGDLVGEGFSCQANMMARAGVPPAMAEGFTGHGGDLADRLLAALEAAEAAGGDVRGRQSAALVVVPGSGESWRTRFDLRVDDHPEPLSELRRLLRFARGYELAGEGDERLAEGAHVAASELYVRAAELAPECDELSFWAGLGLATQDVGAGAELVRQAADRNPAWLELLERLPGELAPAREVVLAALRARSD